MSSVRVSAFLFALWSFLACSEEKPPEPVLPDALPFVVTRPSLGTPIPAAEVTAFTRRITAFWKQVDYFDWVASISHGMDASTGKPDYMVWWHDVEAVKSATVVTFRHNESGGAHNIYIPTPRLLMQAASGYLMTQDASMGHLVEQYSKGITAACKGMVWDENDPNIYLMARNIVTQNHEYEISKGRRKAVDYSAWFNTYENWNAHRVHFPNNPYWGDVWVTNMRSKDDVPHIYTAAPFLRYVAEYGKDASVRDAAAEAYRYVQGFAKDVVDSGYHIRTKDNQGQPYIPDEDLASFVDYEWVVPNGECTGKLSSALLGYGDSQGNDCERADYTDYEGIATATHYYNYAIVQFFHVSAILNALVARENNAAERMVKGLMMRIDRYLDPESGEPGLEHPAWEGDLAVLMVQSAAAGVPLTWDQVRHVQRLYGRALDDFEVWERWNLWDPAVPNGVYRSNGGYRPDHGTHHVDIETMAMFLVYCFSPFRNPNGAAPVDCDVIADVDRWGQ